MVTINLINKQGGGKGKFLQFIFFTYLFGFHCFWLGGGGGGGYDEFEQINRE